MLLAARNICGRERCESLRVFCLINELWQLLQFDYGDIAGSPEIGAASLKIQLA